nr:MAG: hypothetical protein [Bacteriophage sp.]
MGRKRKDDKMIYILNVRLSPDDSLLVSKIEERLNVKRSEAIRIVLRIARRLLQDEETGKINKEIWDRFNDTPPLMIF